MKKYSTAFLFCTVLAILVVGNHVFKTPKLVAVEKDSTDTTQLMLSQTNPSEVVESTMGAKVSAQNTEYALPYPGILPTHPLYFFKELRDRIIEILISDPARKSEFYLLQSDKWLNAGVALLEKGETEKAQEIFKKSGERMDVSVQQLSSLKSSGREIPVGLVDKLESAISKHLEVLSGITEETIDVTMMQESLQTTREDLVRLRS